jgi:AraC-like DNA-binding protein
MYGFAFLSSMNFRQTMRFAVKYQELATPIVEISFKEEGDQAILTIVPIPHRRIDASLYKFVVELQFGSFMSLSRDVIGQSFAARELHVSYRPPGDAQTYPTVFECDVLFSWPENSIVFDAAWLDGEPKLGNEITYSMMLTLCDKLLEEMQLHVGSSAEVRKNLLANLKRPMSFNAVAGRLHMSTRTLRRNLHDENMSFRKLRDELKMHVAIKYLRDTDLTIDDMAHVMGFSDSANFRRAFQRWTKGSPLEFRDISRG